MHSVRKIRGDSTHGAIYSMTCRSAVGRDELMNICGREAILRSLLIPAASGINYAGNTRIRRETLFPTPARTILETASIFGR